MNDNSYITQMETLKKLHGQIQGYLDDYGVRHIILIPPDKYKEGSPIIEIFAGNTGTWVGRISVETDGPTWVTDYKVWVKSVRLTLEGYSCARPRHVVPSVNRTYIYDNAKQSIRPTSIGKIANAIIKQRDNIKHSRKATLHEQEQKKKQSKKMRDFAVELGEMLKNHGYTMDVRSQGENISLSVSKVDSEERWTIKVN